MLTDEQMPPLPSPAIHVGEGLMAYSESKVREYGRAVEAKVREQQWIPVSERQPDEEQGEVLALMEDGSYEIAWASYWHGASNAFAQWSFRDPDETRMPTHWMPLPQPPIRQEAK